MVLADDSGLEVRALGGRPGVRSARFSGKGANDRKNIRKLLRLMKKVPVKKRGARFVCNIAIAKEGRVLSVVEGRCSGKIGFKPRGKFGFGYDPVFISPKHNKTFAELSPRIKNRVSHRARALKKAKVFIGKYLRRHS
jgi:XTP/dITP diphosphohydrolase